MDVVCHVDKDVQADHIDCAERRCLGTADEGSRQPVYFFDRETALLHQLNGLQRGKQPDAVRDEVRRIFRVDDPFSKHDVGKSFEFRKRCAIGFRSWNHFQQFHVSGRIEEMRSKPVPPEILASAFSERRNLQA